MKISNFCLAISILMLAACSKDQPVATGMLESVRLEIVAEISEPITATLVKEGQRVESGQILITQNDARIRASLQGLTASIAQQQALLAEQIAGPRAETIEVAQAAVNSARVNAAFAERELARQQGLGARNLTSQEKLDQARTQVEITQVAVAQSDARLRELLAGTRPEQLEQTRQQIARIEASSQQLMIDHERLLLRAPEAGIVDSLPFETGERPASGAVVAVVLLNDQPQARVYIPAEQRLDLQTGDPALLLIDGMETPIAGSITSLSSEASFTPYFSLTEHDRGNLAYMAEISLEYSGPRLPDGTPVEVSFPAQP